MKKLLSYLLCVLILIFIAAVTYAEDTETSVSTSPRIPKLLVEIVEPVVSVGQPVYVRIKMINDEYRDLPNLPIIVSMEETRLRRIRTDENGFAEVRVNDLIYGKHFITVEFIGTRAYESVKKTVSVDIRPAVITVKTIPTLPNMEFRLDDRVFKSNDDGIAQIEVIETGDYTLEALRIENDYVNEFTKAEFQRWNDSTFTTDRVISVNNDVYYEAGYIVSHPVSLTFHDLEELSVAEKRIDTITIKTSTGDFYTVPDGQVRWFRSTRINRRREGLEATPILYSVESVLIDGSNVVNKYQQRFYVSPNDIWDIQLLLYYAQFQAYDAVFGFPLGTGVNLEYPDGRIEFIPYDEDNYVRIGPMARGTYKVEPVGVSGMKNATPVALSRYQDVKLKVVSALDIGLALVSGALGALVPLLYGRPFLIKMPYYIVIGVKNFLMTLPTRLQSGQLFHRKSESYQSSSTP